MPPLPEQQRIAGLWLYAGARVQNPVAVWVRCETDGLLDDVDADDEMAFPLRCNIAGKFEEDGTPISVYLK